MSDHPVLTAVGVVAVALGVLMLIQPSLAAAVSANYAAVILIGVLALVQCVRVVQTRRRSEIRSAETPDVETVETMPTPGREFDERVAQLRSGPRRMTIRERANLRETLEETAVAAVADRENCSRERARERIDAGTWTDDVHAAAYLGGADAPKPPFLSKLRFVASTNSTYQIRMRRTADAIARAAGVEASDDASTPAERGKIDETASTDGTANTDDSAAGRDESDRTREAPP